MGMTLMGMTLSEESRLGPRGGGKVFGGRSHSFCLSVDIGSIGDGPALN